MPEITDDQVEKLLPALEDAARADPQTTPSRFVPPRIGVLEQAASRRQLFVFGRRGVGKSTMLRKIQHEADDFGARVLFIDVETLRGRPYPDVLIELLVELLKALDEGLREDTEGKFNARVKSMFPRLRLRRLRRELGRLLAEPQAAKHTVRKLHKRNRGASIGLAVPSLTPLSGGVTGARGTSRENSEESEYTQTKMEGLLAAAVEIRRILEAASARLEGTRTLLVLDDFYHVRYDDQPAVLAYLHQVVKNLPIYLKICGVRHRIKPFVEGDPPTGLQLGHDAGEVSLDITLEQFSAAKTFLEKVLDGVCAPSNMSTLNLVTEKGRDRLVLASGGVARDYLDLVSRSLRKANERPERPDRPHNRITAEDVNEAAADVSSRKQDDLKHDAGPEADSLRERLTDVVQFCVERNKTNVFLVEGTHLHESEWGTQIETLADLRLIHQLGNFSLPSGSWRGRRFVGYTLDLSHWAGTRSEQIRQIEFWKPGARQQLRRTGLVYVPGWTGKAKDSDPELESEPVEKPDVTDEPVIADAAPVDWEQPPLPFEEGEADDDAPPDDETPEQLSLT